VTHNEFFETFEHLEQALTACIRDEKKIKEAILSVWKIRLVGEISTGLLPKIF